MPAGTTPVLNDPQKGLVLGDMLLMQNEKGSALGVVTNFNAAARTISSTRTRSANTAVIPPPVPNSSISRPRSATSRTNASD